MAKVSGISGVSGLRGRIGGIVYSQTQAGETLARAYAEPKQPRTPKQTQTQGAMARAGLAWRELTPEQAAQWQAYAESRTTADRAAGRAAAPRPQNVFTGLALKYLQMHPQGIVPALPPPQAFLGDGVSVSVAGGAGGVTFTANSANSPNVTTELLLQPLVSIHRKPEAGKYRTGAFFPFGAGSLAFGLEAEAGIYAAAVRFVQAQTGQASALIALGKVVVL